VAFSGERYEFAIPVTAEVYVTRLLDRDEFRTHCDRHKSRDAILANLQWPGLPRDQLMQQLALHDVRLVPALKLEPGRLATAASRARPPRLAPPATP
jgi:hypothetical protein